MKVPYMRESGDAGAWSVSANPFNPFSLADDANSLTVEYACVDATE